MIHLSKLLNLIDGIQEMPGRIMIMTTNHPEILDEALIRNGRIDCTINFTKCSKQMTIDILNNYYEKDITNLDDFQEYQISPAKLINLCSEYESCDDLIENLNKFISSLPEI